MTSTGALLTSYAAAIAASDWAALRSVLADGAGVTLLHTGERFDADGFVAFNAGYPGGWAFHTEEVVDAGDRGVLRARVEVADGTYHVATFASLGADGRLTDLVEVWTDAVAPHPDRPTASPPREEHRMTHHPLDYLEIGVADVAAAKSFYGSAFGWEFNDYGDAYAGIRSADGESEAGGLNAGAPAGPGGVGPFVRSGDIDASLAAVTAAGGTVLEEPYDYPGGRRFVFSDPDGNRLGVYRPAEG